MSLMHKGLEFETIPWRFTDKDVIAFSGQGRVPVLIDGEHEVHDSWQIAMYLDETYPEKPLMKSTAVRSTARFIKEWVDNAVQPAIRPLVLADIYECIHEKDKAYFLESREKAMGAPIDRWCLDKAKQIAVLDEVLNRLPIRLPVSRTSAVMRPIIPIISYSADCNGRASSCANPSCRPQERVRSQRGSHVC